MRNTASDGATTVTIDWMMLCESAFFDETGRLCMIGIARHFPVPSMPLLLNQHTMVAHLATGRLSDGASLSFKVRTPSECWITPTESEAVTVKATEEYILITVRSLPFREEGLYRFDVSVDGDSLASVEIPVWLVPPRWSLLDVH